MCLIKDVLDVVASGPCLLLSDVEVLRGLTRKPPFMMNGWHGKSEVKRHFTPEESKGQKAQLSLCKKDSTRGLKSSYQTERMPFDREQNLPASGV